MRLYYIFLALFLGWMGIMPAWAEKELVVTDTGTPISSLAELKDGDVVMLWNSGRSKFAENHIYDDGTYKCILGYDFVAGQAGSRGFLWKLEKVEQDNAYRLISLADNKYMTCTFGSAPRKCSTTDVEEDVDFFTFSVSNEANKTFLLKSNRATTGEGKDIYLNGQGGGSNPDNVLLVVYPDGSGANSQYMIYKPVTAEKDFVTVSYTCKFFDGNSDKPMDELYVPAEALSTITVKAAPGDSVTVPVFDNNTVRSVMNGTEVLSDTSVFKMPEGGDLDLTVNYTSDPAFTFTCTVDASQLADGNDYAFSDGTEEQIVIKRVPVGDKVSVPLFSNFTPLTSVSETSATSKSFDVAYRPWREITFYCVYMDEVAGETPIRTVTVNVDIDSTLTAPDMGTAYQYDAEATADMGEGLPLPLVVTPENIDLGMGYVLVYKRGTAPFTLSTVDKNGVPAEDATWYIIRLRGTKVLTNKVNDDGYLILTADATIDDNALWCVVQAANGSYLFVNKAKEGYVLSDDGGTFPELLSYTGDENGFEYVSISNGYGLRVNGGGENQIWNDKGNKTPGQLGYWENANVWNDAGSVVTFEEYDAEKYTFLRGRAYLNAENCVGGFTAGQLEQVRRPIEEGEFDMEEEVEAVCDELDLLSASERVQYDAAHAYALVSAAPEYILRENAKMALYVQDDTLLAWKEFDPEDLTFYFELRDMETLSTVANPDAVQDSTVFALYNIGTGTYVDGNFSFGGKVKLTAAYDREADRFHMEPVAELRDADNKVTRSYEPAAFYVDRIVQPSSAATTAKPVKVTLSMHLGKINTNTEGTMTSYNTHADGIGSIFRFLDCGKATEVGIGDVTADRSAGTDDALYDLSGRRVLHPTKGVYIRNGKKVYVK